MITVREQFPDDDVELEATFDVEPMADAIGAEPFERQSLAGQVSAELHRCIDLSTRKEHEPSAWQYQCLEEKAVKEFTLCSR